MSKTISLIGKINSFYIPNTVSATTDMGGVGERIIIDIKVISQDVLDELVNELVGGIYKYAEKKRPQNITGYDIELMFNEWIDMGDKSVFSSRGLAIAFAKHCAQVKEQML